jgi:5-methyltetrahydropteroyltriglutamate--homocysteine methyltransferase
MNTALKRPFRADHIGSLLRPSNLLEARRRHHKGELGAAALRAVEDQCIREVVKMQEDLGLKGITDGEFRRHSWNTDFLAGFRNVTRTTGNLPLFHRNPDGTSTGEKISAWAVDGKIDRKGPIQVEAFKFLKSVTTGTPKTCIPSPTLLHFRGGRKAISTTAYPDIDGFFSDVAKAYNDEMKDLYAAGCRYLQLDDTNFAYLCDQKFRDAAKQMGEDPAKLVGTYCRLVNDSLRGRPDDLLVGLHLCRGNMSVGGAASGSYEMVAEELFTTLDVDAFFLEYDDERAGGFEPLRFVPKHKSVVLGLITTKRPELEDRALLKRRIDAASKFLPLEQLCLSPQCGFASVEDAKRATAVEDEKAKIRLMVETAREVWGEI